MLRWAIITGEYPPQPGGVSDYTRLVARGLAEAGDEVHVWAPECPQPAPPDPGVEVHRLSGRFGPRALITLDRALDRNAFDRILVQYVPHAFGWKAMNVPFCLWLASRRLDSIWVMFHEVAFPCSPRQSPKHNLLGLTTHFMARIMARAAQRIFVSTRAWEPLLRRPAASEPQRVIWLPVPSNLPVKVSDTAIAAARSRASAEKIVGHFGSFGPHVVSILNAALPPLLMADRGRAGMLLGHGSQRFARELALAYPQLSGRVISMDGVSTDTLAAHMAACDLLVQPYPDGVTSRRTSLIAGLALGLPIVTTMGPLTETLWEKSEAVVLAAASSSAALVGAAEALLVDNARRAMLGARAAALYRSHFAIEHTLRELRV